MKNCIPWILSALIVLGLPGCAREPKYERPVTFYYRTAALSHDAGSRTILSETRESAHLNTVEEILQVYLAGPESETLRSPFPGGIEIVEFAVWDGTAYVILSGGFAELSGLALVMACACLTMTCLELSGAEKVCISAENALLDGEKSIIMDRNSLLLLDEAIPATGGK